MAEITKETCIAASEIVFKNAELQSQLKKGFKIGILKEQCPITQQNFCKESIKYLTFTSCVQNENLKMLEELHVKKQALLEVEQQINQLTLYDQFLYFFGLSPSKPAIEDLQELKKSMDEFENDFDNIKEVCDEKSLQALQVLDLTCAGYVSTDTNHIEL